MSGSKPLPDNALLLWLQDESNNDYLSLEKLEEMYTLFAEDQPDPIEEFKDDDRYHNYLIFADNEEGMASAQVLHHLAKFPKRVGVATPYDNKWYVTSQQPVLGQHITTILPFDLFDPTKDVQTYTTDRIQREISHDPSLESITVEVTNDNLADLVTIKTRRGMWIPNQYAALVLEENLSPAQVWVRLYSQILRDGAIRACKPLIQFLQVQMLGLAAENVALYDSDRELSQPRPSASLSRHRNQVLIHLMQSTPASLSGIVAPASGAITTANFQDLIDAMRNNQSSSMVPAPIAVAGTTESRIEKRWSVNLNTLLLFNLANKASDLPAIYGSIADGTRKQEKATLQAGYNDLARSPGAATTAPLVITKELTSTLLEMIFWSGDLDRLDEGFHCFRTIYVMFLDH